MDTLTKKTQENINVAVLLISAGTDLTIVSNKGQTALGMAIDAFYSYNDMLKPMIERGADLSIVDRDKLLFLAVNE